MHALSTNYSWKVISQTERDEVLPTGEILHLTKGYNEDDPKIHIGMRSGSGLYCWDCNNSLVIGGVRQIHAGDAKWASVCSLCKKSQKDSYPTRFEKLNEELPEAVAGSRPTGIAGSCSFMWAQEPEKVLKVLEARPTEILILDEYNKPLTCAEFAKMLQNSCPIHFIDNVGLEFT